METLNLTALNDTDGNSTTAAPFVGLTTYELWIQLLFFYGFCCGIVATVCSVLIWVGIARSKKLRNRFFIIVAWITFCRTWIGVQYFAMAFFRSLRTLGVFSVYQYRVVCHTAVHFWLFNGWTVEMCLLLTLVIDRIIAIVASSYYRRLSTEAAFYTCAVIFIVVSVAKLIPSYMVIDLMEIAPCIDLNSVSLEMNEYGQDLDFVLVAIILICYVGLLLFVRKKVRTLKKSVDSNTSAANIALNRQLKLMPVLRNLVLMHCVLSMSSKIMMLLGAQELVPRTIARRMTAYGGIMGSLDVCINCSMLLVTNSDIRAASLPCLTRYRSIGNSAKQEGHTDRTSRNIDRRLSAVTPSASFVLGAPH